MALRGRIIRSTLGVPYSIGGRWGYLGAGEAKSHWAWSLSGSLWACSNWALKLTILALASAKSDSAWFSLSSNQGELLVDSRQLPGQVCAFLKIVLGYHVPHLVLEIVCSPVHFLRREVGFIRPEGRRESETGPAEVVSAKAGAEQEAIAGARERRPILRATSMETIGRSWGLWRRKVLSRSHKSRAATVRALPSLSSGLFSGASTYFRGPHDLSLKYHHRNVFNARSQRLSPPRQGGSPLRHSLPGGPHRGRFRLGDRLLPLSLASCSGNSPWPRRVQCLRPLLRSSRLCVPCNSSISLSLVCSIGCRLRFPLLRA